MNKSNQVTALKPLTRERSDVSLRFQGGWLLSECLGNCDDQLDLSSGEKLKTCWGHLDKNKRNTITPSQLELNCISDSFVDNAGYFISSKGFLPTIVYIMVM